MHLYQCLTARAREVRDLHLESVPKAKREALTEVYKPFIEALVSHQMYWTEAYESIAVGRHGLPTSLRENRRLELIDDFLKAGESGDWESATQVREQLLAYGLLNGRENRRAMTEPNTQQESPSSIQS